MLQSSGWLSFFTPWSERHFLDYLHLLYVLKENKSVKEVFYIVPEMHASWQQIEQIASSLQSIAKSGKILRAHSSGGNYKTMYLLAAANYRYASRHANFLMLLPSYDSYFFKEALDRLGIKIETQSAGLYKGSGYESFTRRGFSQTSRRSMGSLVNSLRSEIEQHFVKKLPVSVKTSKASLALMRKKGLLQSKELLQCGFLTELFPANAWIDQLLVQKGLLGAGKVAHPFAAKYSEHSSQQKDPKMPQKKERKGTALHILQERLMAQKKIYYEAALLSAYKRSKFAAVRLRRIPSIAFVVMEGAISMGKTTDKPRPSSIAALPFCNILQELIQNQDEAVFLYINSPGGSADASELLFETIYELSRIKPVFALVGAVAASGAYYIACAANRIYASPLSLTGSIGVIRLRPDLAALYKKMGVRKEYLVQDPTRDIFSEAGPLSAASKKMLSENLNSTYTLFIDRVSQGRRKSSKEVKEMAEGRVFSGKQFIEGGMIDGSLDFMGLLEEYKKAAAKKSDQAYKVCYYPQVKPDLQSLLKEYILLGKKGDAQLHSPFAAQMAPFLPFALNTPAVEKAGRAALELLALDKNRPLLFCPHASLASCS